MAVAEVLRSLVVTGVVAAGPLVPPSELLVDHIPGFEPTGGPATDLDFAEFATIEPDSVAHIDPDSEEAAGLLAAMQTWAEGGAGETIVVEIVRAIDEGAAATLVDQAAANSIAVGLGAVDPPFGGAWSYSGEIEDSWRNVVAWTQGPYAVIMTQLSAAAVDDRSVVDDAAVRQVETILAATGAEVSEDAAVDDEAPTPPTEAPPPEDEDDGGFPVGSLMVVLLVVGVGIGVMLQQRRRFEGAR